MSLTLRQQAAAAALQGALSNASHPGDRPEGYALNAVRYADALIAELEATPARADVVKAGTELIAALESEISRLRKGDPSRSCDRCDRCARSEESAASPPGCYHCRLHNLDVAGEMYCPNWIPCEAKS